MVNGDGANAIQNTRINKSFAKGTPVKTVIKEIAAQLGLSYSSAIKQCESLDKNLEHSFAASSNPIDELCCILRHFGYSASVQNQALQIIKKGEPLEQQTISLSANSGVIATPELGSDKKIQIKSVLMPELLPGSTVHVDSAVFKGFAIIQSVRFDGSNFDDAWGRKWRVKFFETPRF